MFKLLKGGQCYAPEKLGQKDILIAYGKIGKIEDTIPMEGLWDVEVFDCSNQIICPGFIDQHVHILGGGGEEGPGSRIPEIMLGEIISAGVTTVVGLLGADGITRTVAGLLSKARALELEGVSTFIYTGSYGVPTTTLTGKVILDIALIDKIIGVGEIAIADYRSSHPTVQGLKELAYEAKVGGLLGGKAGVMHIHVGDGKEGLNALFELIQESNFPIEMFIPTHMNRKKELLHQGIEYARLGGFIDLTAGEKSSLGYSVPEAIKKLIASGVDMNKVTISSDGNGSIPATSGSNGEIGKVMTLFEDIKKCMIENNSEIELVLKLVTSNVAKILKIYPQKGTLKVGSDADINVLNQNMEIDKLFIGGDVFIKDKNIMRKGRFE